MSTTGTINWLRDANFAGWSLDWSRLEGIETLFHQKGPVHEFIDKDLEVLRRAFYAAVKNLLVLLATETFPVGSGNRQAIPEDWEDEQPEHFKKAVKDAHAVADLVLQNLR